MNEPERRSPIPAVGVVCLRGDEVLLIRRGTPPLADRWSLPGGRIEWGERAADAAMREAIAADEPEDAVTLYRNAVTRLRRGDYLHAATLHALGAQALAAVGDEHGATVAREHAQAAREVFERHLPAELRKPTDSPS